MAKIWTDDKVELLNKLKEENAGINRMIRELGLARKQIEGRLYREPYVSSRKPAVNSDGLVNYATVNLIPEETKQETLGSRLEVNGGIYKLDGHMVSIITVIKIINKMLKDAGKPALGRL